MYVPKLGTTTASFAGQADGTALAMATTVTRATTITFGCTFRPRSRHRRRPRWRCRAVPPAARSPARGSDADYSVAVAGCSEGTLAVSIGAGTVWDDLGYLAPACEATSDTVLIDRTAPVTKKPSMQLPEGARLSGSAVPVRSHLEDRTPVRALPRSRSPGAWTAAPTRPCR